MKFSWLLNGTMDAHHVVAVYAAVWLVQGGYACWIAWHRTQTRQAAAGMQTKADPQIVASAEELQAVLNKVKQTAKTNHLGKN